MRRCLVFIASISVLWISSAHAESVSWKRGQWDRPSRQIKINAVKGNGKAIQVITASFGVVDLYKKVIDDGFHHDWSSNRETTYVTINQPLQGFYIDAVDCPPIIYGAGRCAVNIEYQPMYERVDTAEGEIKLLYYFRDSNNQLQSDEDIYTFELSGEGVRKPDQDDGEECGSYIRVTDRVLGERVPIVGTDYSLMYSSRFASQYTPDSSYSFTPHYSFAEDGWIFSPQRYYDRARRRLFSPDGTIESKISGEVDSGLFGVVSADGEEAYIFTSTGKHLQTLMTLTGVVKYEFEYDSNDRLIKITDKNGLETVVARNSSGRVISITSPYSQVTTTTHTGSGLLASITNPNSETHSFTYKTGTELLETFTKPGGQVSTFTYNSSGRLIKDLGHGGNFWDLMESAGIFTKSSHMGRVTTYEKTRYLGNSARQETSPSGLVTTFTRNLDNSSSRVSAIDEESTTLVDDERFEEGYRRLSVLKYKTVGQTRTTNISQSFNYGSGAGYFDYVSRTRTFNTNGRIWTEVFNLSNKTLTMTSPGGATSQVIINDVESPIQLKKGNDTAFDIAYDLYGRLEETSQGVKNQSVFAYGSNGKIQSITNGRSEVTSFSYDLAGRVTQVTFPDLRTIGLQYDANGNQTGIVTASSVTHGFELNTMELTSKYVPPVVSGLSPKDTTYNYNLDKQLTQILRPDSKYASYSYEATTGRLTSIATNDGSYSYSYSSTKPDLVEEISSPQGIKNVFSYRGREIASDEQVRVSDNASLGKVTFGYDSDHRVISRTVQDSTSATAVTNYTLNDDDRPTAVGSMSLSYSYPSGRLSTTNLDRVSDARSYDIYGNLETYTATYTPAVGSPEVLYSYTLVRDSMSRIVGKTETVLGPTSTFEYHFDVAGRLTSVDQNSVEVMAYTYDLNGNRTSIKRGAATFNATYDAQDRILTFGTKSYAHNQNGDLTQVSGLPGLPANFSYDVFGNLREASVPSGKTFSYGHDGRNRRVERKEDGVTVARYLYQDQYRIASEMTPAGVLKKLFVYATDQHVPDYMTEAGVNYRIITDHLGSPRLVVNADTGAVVQRMDFDTLGRVTRDSNSCFQPFGFAGGLLDHDTRLVRFSARDYDPETGRWTSKDPILFNGGDTNLYGYVMSDPVNFIDPTGLWRWPGAIYDDAMRDARNSGLPGPHNGQQDAYRHCLASCMMTQENGSFLAQLLGDANEKRGDWFHNQESGEKCMDQNNNSRGRDFGRGGGNCSQQCAAAAGNGGLSTYTSGSTPGYWGY